MTDDQVDETPTTGDGSGAIDHPTRRSRREAESSAPGTRQPRSDSSDGDAAHRGDRPARPAAGRRSATTGAVPIVPADAVPAATPPVPAAPGRPATSAAPVLSSVPPVLSSVPPVRRRGARALRGAVSTVAVAAIAGMVAVMALPAYSFDPADDSQAAVEAAARIRALGTQKLTVSASATQEQVIRDSFTAPTQQQLDEAAAQARALAEAAERAAREAQQAQEAEEAAASGTSTALPGSSTSVTPREEGDDYPWRDQLTDDEGGGLSPLRYYYRECVDFVAWRLNRDQGSTGAPWKWTWGNMTPGGGSAYAWAGQWASHGWVTSSTPVPGSVAWFTGNHVAYVQSVNSDGTVSLEEYNWGNDHSYHTRTVPASSVPLFLYPPS